MRNTDIEHFCHHRVSIGKFLPLFLFIQQDPNQMASLIPPNQVLIVFTVPGIS
jgi:hypothetical protein